MWAKTLTALLLLITSGVAFAEAGLFVFVFKQGEIQPGIRIVVGDQERQTNAYGMAEFTLPAGEYEVSYYQQQELFALTDVRLLDNQQSQIFLTLTRDNNRESVELDLPLSAYDADFEEQTIQEQTGPKGQLTLKLFDARDKLPITDARIYFKGYNIEASSDKNGLVETELSEGSYDLSIIHPKYILSVQRDISITAEQTTELEVAMTRSDIELEEYVVSAPFVEGSLASSISALKESDVVGDALSSEQFSKSGDSSASSALKRVTGITVVDGKYVYIRGLGERYSTVLLNDLHIPSPEPTKRVVPLDIFPTDVIQSMDIQKTWSSNLPGTFAGGTILIETRDIPEEDNYVKASIGNSFNQSTGSSALYNADNSNPLPSEIIRFSNNFGVLTQEVKVGEQVIAEGLTAAEKDALNRAMVSYRNYGLSERNIEPGLSGGLSFGQSFKTTGGLKYGFAGAFYYKTTDENESYQKDEYYYDQANDSNLHTESGSFNFTEFEEKVGGLVSFGVDNLKGQSLKYTLLALDESADTTTFGTRNKLIEGTYHERTYLEYVEKDLFAHQLNGSHQLGEAGGGYLRDIVLDWGAETAEANRLEPGTFEYEYKIAAGQQVVDAKKLFYLYSDLHDSVDNVRLDVKLPFTANQQENYTHIGFFNYVKSRNLDNRRFKIKYDDSQDPSAIDDALSIESIDEGILDVLDSYKPDDFYTAEQTVNAFYINQLYSPLESLDLNIGFRQEDSTQSLVVGEEQEQHELDTSDLLPFLGMTYRFNDEHQLRAGFTQTISRPDFREFSPNRYKDPLTGNIIFGYEGLKYTTITNLDIKYEWYPSFDESWSFALFNKKFDNPIETVRTISDVEIETSYRNAKSANSVGVEVGFRQNLDKFLPALNFFFVSGNYTWIDSQITLDKNSPENINDQFIPYLTTDSRPMQGQSPYVINLQFGYDNFNTRRSAILLYNEFGERISELGIFGNPDIYELPFRKLDFVMKWGLNDNYDEQVKKIAYDLSFKAENLLDSARTLKQGSATSLKYYPGMSFSLSFSMKY